MANLYATDGKCHNSEPGSYGHECGRPAQWIGENAAGFRAGFCADCKAHGTEAREVVVWEPVPLVRDGGHYPCASLTGEATTVERLRRDIQALSPEARREFLAWARRAL